MITAKQFLQRITALSSDAQNLKAICAEINRGNSTPIVSAVQLKQVYDHMLKQPELEDKLAKMQGNRSLNFLNEFSFAEVLILKLPNNQLELILLPKNRVEKTQNGSKKELAIAYRIDDITEEDIKRARLKINLVSKAEETADKPSLGRVIKEALISQKCAASPYISVQYLSTPFIYKKDGNDVSAIYLFAKLALCDLTLGGATFTPFLDALLPLLNDTENTQYLRSGAATPSFFNDIVYSLLAGLRDMHASRVVHIDIDFRNILLGRYKEKLAVRYADFDNCIDLELHEPDIKRGGGTFTTMSPDLFAAFLHYETTSPNRKITREELIAIFNQRNSYGWSVYYQESQAGSDYLTDKSVDFKDNSWAVGVVIFKLLTGRLPALDRYTAQVIAANSLLQGLLAPKAEQRFNAEQALACWQQRPVLQNVMPDLGEMLHMFSALGRLQEQSAARTQAAFAASEPKSSASSFAGLKKGFLS